MDIIQKNLTLPNENLVFLFFPQKFLYTIGYHPNTYFIKDLGHLWGIHLKNYFEKNNP